MNSERSVSPAPAAGLHPVIRVVAFLVFAASLALGGAPQLALAALLLACAYLGARRGCLAAGLRMVYRIRWLIFSLLLIHFWWTPGQAVALPVPEAVAAWLPTAEGVRAGVLRAAILGALVLAVNLLLAATDRDQLLFAVRWLAGPLRVLGIAPERLAVRMALVVDSLAAVQQLVGAALVQWRGRPARWRQAGEFSADLFTEVTQRAAAAPCREISVLDCGPPPRWQWLYPLLLWAAFVLAG